MKTPAYKAKQHAPVNPRTEVPGKGEYTSAKVEGNTRPMKKPSKLGTSGVLVDGPYGCKKPA